MASLDTLVRANDDQLRTLAEVLGVPHVASLKFKQDLVSAIEGRVRQLMAKSDTWS